MTFKSLKIKNNFRKKSERVIIHLFLILSTLIVLFPFVYMIVTSLKTLSESYDSSFFPKNLTFENYKKILIDNEFYDVSIFRALWNTIKVVTPPTVIGLIVSSAAAYAFAKIKYKGSGVLFAILLFSMMLPGTLTLTPSYILYSRLNLTDTYFPLMIPGMFGSAACVFFMREYYGSIPTEIIEAAKIDGASQPKILFTIMFPLSKSAMFAQLVLNFLGGYNDFFGPFLYLKGCDESMYTLQIYLKGFQSTVGTRWTLIMAGAVISIIPSIFLFLVTQKYFRQGIIVGAIK